jgi:hypothetical protein
MPLQNLPRRPEEFHLEPLRIVDLHTEVSHPALDLGVVETRAEGRLRSPRAAAHNGVLDLTGTRLTVPRISCGRCVNMSFEKWTAVGD